MKHRLRGALRRYEHVEILGGPVQESDELVDENDDVIAVVLARGDNLLMVRSTADGFNFFLQALGPLTTDLVLMRAETALSTYWHVILGDFPKRRRSS